MRWLNNITDSMKMNLSKLWEIVEDRGAWSAAVNRVTKRQSTGSQRVRHNLAPQQQQ